MRRKIVLIADSAEVEERIHQVLRGGGYTIKTLNDRAGDLDRPEMWAGACDLVILEDTMLEARGADLMSEVRVIREDLPVFVVTRGGDWSGYARALSAGAAHYAIYPFDRDEFLQSLENALQAEPLAVRR